MLEESSVYQDIFQKGIKIGVQEGMQNIIIRLLVRRCGKLSLNLHKQIKSLSLKQLEQLSEDLLDFKTKNDLTVWLNKNASAH
jgi:hypothetical protein